VNDTGGYDDYELVSYSEEYKEDIPLNFLDRVINWFRVKFGYLPYKSKWVAHKDTCWPSSGCGTFEHNAGGSERVTSPVHYEY
jgi:hypothetical protein